MKKDIIITILWIFGLLTNITCIVFTSIYASAEEPESTGQALHHSINNILSKASKSAKKAKDLSTGGSDNNVKDPLNEYIKQEKLKTSQCILNM